MFCSVACNNRIVEYDSAACVLTWVQIARWELSLLHQSVCTEMQSRLKDLASTRQAGGGRHEYLSSFVKPSV